MSDTDTVIVGAGPAGLAMAACLRMAGARFTVLEASGKVGHSWRNHYERLHLHTPRQHSSLPGFRMPAEYPEFPSRQQVVDYLEAYAKHFAIEPRFEERVERVSRTGDGWRTVTSGGEYASKHVVIATGYNRDPRRPVFPGEDEFTGDVLHSGDYRNGSSFVDRRVLVVGSGNTGAEIAVDLVEHGAASVAMCVRGVVDVVPRELFGFPITSVSIQSASLPVRIRDVVTTLISRMTFGNLSRYGLHASGRPMSRIQEAGRIPLIDVGTIGMVKEGRIRVVGAIETFTSSGVRVPEGELPLDAVVLATGYRPALADFLEDADALIDERGYPMSIAENAPLPGLYFLGFRNPATGLIRSIGIDARAIQSGIAATTLAQ